jgi:hypothetical protein
MRLPKTFAPAFLTFVLLECSCQNSHPAALPPPPNPNAVPVSAWVHFYEDITKEEVTVPPAKYGLRSSDVITFEDWWRHYASWKRTQLPVIAGGKEQVGQNRVVVPCSEASRLPVRTPETGSDLVSPDPPPDDATGIRIGNGISTVPPNLTDSPAKPVNLVPVPVEAVNLVNPAPGDASAPVVKSICDLNNDGVVNVLDVQRATDMALAKTKPCPFGLDGTSACTTADVERVLAAAMGLPCPERPPLPPTNLTTTVH